MITTTDNESTRDLCCRLWREYPQHRIYLFDLILVMLNELGADDPRAVAIEILRPVATPKEIFQAEIAAMDIVWNHLQRDPQRFMTAFKNITSPGDNVVPLAPTQEDREP
jgi:hypothetical protein